MIRKSNERITAKKPGPFGGAGEVTITCLLNSPEEMEAKGRAFNHITVHPGAEIGYHVHTGDAETYYILSGSGVYNDNGTEVTLHAGDVACCAAGEGHGLKNNTDEPIEMIALILYA